ncbi:MAG TPA: hypothetical protein VHE36_02385 [Sphingomicrobium sp.]|nr:hypothetical protein [Sphingomicrobium sp.]
MTKRVSLDRLRDISKQRSIRRPVSGQAADRIEAHGEVGMEGFEWPIPSSHRS